MTQLFMEPPLFHDNSDRATHFCWFQDKNLTTNAELGQKRTVNGRRFAEIRQEIETMNTRKWTPVKNVLSA
jgi:hypothetical protein